MNHGGYQIRIAPFLDALFDQGASDLVLSVGAPPSLRIDGQLVPAASSPLTPDQTDSLMQQLISEAQQASFKEHLAVDFSFDWQDRGRVRGNAFRQRGTTSLALRAIPHVIPTFAELRLPKILERLVDLPPGPLPVPRPTPSG